ncbi:MAG: hypothetical protein KBG47_04570 [Bacteroidia bacterium]|nr:hypothetical protein [Bacteroidia bacterium]
MANSTEILLLTASVDPAASKTPFTHLLDPKLRLQEYLQNIKRIIEEGVFEKIVFCENTNYNYDYSEIVRFAKSKNVELEPLVFEGNYEKISHQGKGYGEGQIIKYAIMNSKLLLPDSVFYKLTGRIFIRNIASIVRKNKAKEVIFIRAQRKVRIVDARFFKTSVAFFKAHLMEEFVNVNDPEKHYLEMVYFEKLQTINGISRFNEFPYFMGVSGSTGKKYDQSLYEYLKYSLLLKAGFLNIR